MAVSTEETREFRAAAKFQRVSPQKARLVLDLIKGLRVEQALNTIAFTKKGVAPMVEKVLRSALQNANYLSDERGLDLDVDNLYVKSAIANEGPRLKRIRPAPMGRAFRYQRRMAHILISVAELGPEQAATGDRASRKAGAAAKPAAGKGKSTSKAAGPGPGKAKKKIA
ncbi:MAG TPA: 50S ribosomal protein L22 [Acidobacteriaceae bacterium]